MHLHFLALKCSLAPLAPTADFDSIRVVLLVVDNDWQLFARSLLQFDRIRKRNAFMDNYRKEPMFADNLDEFEDSR